MATKRKRYVYRNEFYAEGARGGAYIHTTDDDCPDGFMRLAAGWSCVVVHQDHTPIPVSWVAEVIAIATEHKNGIEGFLREHGQGGSDGGPNGNSWALMADPPK